MKISINWLKDYAAIPEDSSTSLAEKVTLTTCEIEGFDIVGEHLKSVVAARILSYRKHPDAHKLSLVTVSDGSEQLEIVCGASNFKDGDIVPLAKVGCELPGGLKIKRSKIRGVESCGMLCAEDELGLSDDHAGLMILPAATKPGMSLSELFPDSLDIIITIDNKSITHRPDLWGHHGFARELAAIYKVAHQPMNTALPPNIKNGEPLISVDVKPESQAKRFTALGISGLKVLPSLDKVRYRLHRVGLRAINNLVDVTNYVMLDCGQPMHAFDAERIPGRKLDVRRGKAGEKLMTLQNKEASLSAEDVVICDGEGPTAIAGVIGGHRSGISDSTQKLFLEAGCWDPVLVRRSSTRIGVRTDASQRYEKSLDATMTLPSIIKALEILTETCPKMQISGGLYDYIAPAEKAPAVKLRYAKTSLLLGVEVAPAMTEDILARLGFKTKEVEGGLNVTIPSWRATKDVSIEEDLIEEIGRFYGVNNIPPAPPRFPIEKPTYNEQRRFERLVKEFLAANGMLEVYTYPLSSAEAEKRLGFRGIEPMRLLNPVAAQHHQMKTTMLPLFISAMQENQKHASSFALFEVGKTYGRKKDGGSFENNRLIMALSSEKPAEEAFNLMRRTVVRLLSRIKLEAAWRQATPDSLQPYMHPLRSVEIDIGKQKNIGSIYTFTKSFLKEQDLLHSVFMAEFDFDGLFKLFEAAEIKKVPPLPRYPSVVFDVSIWADAKDNFAYFKDMLTACDKRVEEVSYLYDYKPPEAVGKKSLTVSIVFRDPVKTLSTEEADQLREKVVKTLDKNGYKLR